MTSERSGQGDFHEPVSERLEELLPICADADYEWLLFKAGGTISVEAACGAKWLLVASDCRQKKEGSLQGTVAPEG